MKIVIAASSSGGHFYPGLSFIEAFGQKIKNEVLFILPAKTKIKNNFKNYPYNFEELDFSFPAKRISRTGFLALVQLVRAFFKARKILKKFKPDFILSLGSYSSLPVCLAGGSLKIPIFIYESNVLPGVANRITAKFCRCFLAAFEKTKEFIKPKNFKVVGTVVRPEFFGPDDKNILAELGFKNDQKVLLVFGGSQGAASLNEVVLKILKEKKDPLWSQWQIIHSAGSGDFERIKKESQKLAPQNYFLAPFLDPFWPYLKAADLVISRSGASTLAEIAAARVGAIFVPYPFATGNHQHFNALFLTESEAAFLVKDDDLLFENLKGIIQKINEEPEILEKIRQNLKQIPQKDSAQLMIKEILRNLNEI